MAATRFYFPAEGSGAPSISPAFDGGWEQTGQATRLKLLNKRALTTLSAIAADGTRTVPITTTQDILCNQFVSDVIPPQLIDASCTFSLVISVLESVASANVTLAVVCKVVDAAGTARGTLFSTFNTGTEFGTSQATRIVSASAVTALGTQSGDRIVVEIGGHAAGPTAAQTYTMRQGNNNAADFALTAALTTDLNPWCEFSNDVFSPVPNNFQFLKAGDGISVGEKGR